MRRHCLQLAWLCLALTPLAQAEEQSPYTAYINADDVYVRSGPGQNYYPTCKLARGEAVEVYRHDPGGWFAIRPPEGSFSWISAKYLKLGKDGIATISGDRVVARIGSELSDLRDVIQVRLDRGEEVEILETREQEAGDGRQTWCKVSPVAGEFRWISGKYLDRAPQSPGNPGDSQRNLLLSKRTAEQVDDDAAEEDAPPDHQSVARGGFRPVGRSAATAPPPRDSILRSSNDGRAQWASFDREDPAGAEPVVSRSTTKRVPPRATANQRPREEQFRAEVEDLDLALSNMVVEESATWSFDELHEQAELLLARAQTSVERGHARLLLSKIARFEEIQVRFGSAAEMQARTDRRRDPARETAAAGTGSMTRPSEPPRFDGSGRLAKVLSQRVGAPQYALLDEAGGILMYVSAAPGTTLKQFVGHHVGIVGMRGYHPQMNATHVTVRQVSLLR